MDAVRVYIVIVRQHYLKIQLFHVFVGNAGCFFFCIYVLYHSLIDGVEVPGLYLAISALYIPVIFFYFFPRVFIIWGRSVYDRRFSDAAIERDSAPNMNLMSYFSLHLCCLCNRIFLFQFCLLVVFVIVIVCVVCFALLSVLFLRSLLAWA